MTLTRANPLAGIVFDLDGTLIDSSADIARSVNLVLAGHDLPPQSVQDVHRHIGSGPRELFSGIYRELEVTVSPERLEVDIAAYVQHGLRNPVVHARPYRDAAQALPALRRAGVRLGICTNKIQRLAETALSGLDLAQYFDVVIGVDVLGVRKPDPRHLLGTLQRMGVSPQEALYVGDMAIDAETSHNADVEFLLVEWADPGLGQDPPLRRLSHFSELVDMAASRPSAAARDGTRPPARR
jgi:phosphoglycolate phosphatase